MLGVFDADGRSNLTSRIENLEKGGGYRGKGMKDFVCVNK